MKKLTRKILTNPLLLILVVFIFLIGYLGVSIIWVYLRTDGCAYLNEESCGKAEQCEGLIYNKYCPPWGSQDVCPSMVDRGFKCVKRSN